MEPSAPADPPDVAAYVVWNAADELAEPAFDRLRANDLAPATVVVYDPGGRRAMDGSAVVSPGWSGAWPPMGAISSLWALNDAYCKAPGRPGSATARSNARSFAPSPPHPGDFR